jgi:hypothetical protein
MFKRILTLCVLTAALVAAQPAERWTHWFTAGGEGNTTLYYYLDASSLRYRASKSTNVPNDYASIWTKVVTQSSGVFHLDHIEQHYATRHQRILSWAEYDAKGNPISSSSTPGAWNDIVPDSVADGLFHRLWKVDQ